MRSSVTAAWRPRRPQLWAWSNCRSGLQPGVSIGTDRFVFDVAHQGYSHKLLTGRGGDFFRRLRQTGRGERLPLPCRKRARCLWGRPWPGTALSAALGMATGRDLRGSSEHVVAVCGDAAFTCGITLKR